MLLAHELLNVFSGNQIVYYRCSFCSRIWWKIFLSVDGEELRRDTVRTRWDETVYTGWNHFRVSQIVIKESSIIVSLTLSYQINDYRIRNSLYWLYKTDLRLPLVLRHLFKRLSLLLMNRFMSLVIQGLITLFNCFLEIFFNGTWVFSILFSFSKNFSNE